MSVSRKSFARSSHGAFVRSAHGARVLSALEVANLFLSADDKWFARESSEGDVIWEVDRGVRTRGVALSTEERLYHCGDKVSGDSLFRVNKTSGDIVWSLSLMDECFRIAALDNVIYVVGNTSTVQGASTNMVKVIDNGTSGAIVWKKLLPFGGALESRGVGIHLGTEHVVASGAAAVKRFNSAGIEQWSFDIKTGIFGLGVSQTTSSTYVAHNWSSALGSLRSLTKLNSSGSEVWGFDSGGVLNDAVVDGDGNVYTCGVRRGGKSIWKVSESTGTEIWSQDVGASANNMDVDSDGFVYVTNGNGQQTHKLDPSDGSIIWTRATGPNSNHIAARILTS